LRNGGGSEGTAVHTFNYAGADGQALQYADRWRSRWLLSVAFPLLPLFAILAAEASGWRGLLWAPLGIVYFLIPMLDWLVGTDTHNPPEGVVPQLERDAYYRWLTCVSVPLQVATMIGGFWYAMVVARGFAEVFPVVLALGFSAALAINTGHELGHKGDRLERFLALLALAVSGYGHFRIEHNLGHHAQVSTPEDSASARMGESVYRFALREMPGGLGRAWRLETARLRRAGHSSWSTGNEILQGLALTLLLQGGLTLWLGWMTLPWLALHNLWAWFQLTGVNYVEHYGLLRRRRGDGGYERCGPRHSWNSNHAVSNVLLFQLQRHSDHHAHAERRYQSLRHHHDAPQLPTGYMGMLPLTYLPALFFRIMDRRLLAAAGGDLARVNVDPARRAAIEERYPGLASSPK
jgi:alkane 1-monooxygenase